MQMYPPLARQCFYIPCRANLSTLLWLWNALSSSLLSSTSHHLITNFLPAEIFEMQSLPGWEFKSRLELVSVQFWGLIFIYGVSQWGYQINSVIVFNFSLFNIDLYSIPVHCSQFDSTVSWRSKRNLCEYYYIFNFSELVFMFDLSRFISWGITGRRKWREGKVH